MARIARAGRGLVAVLLALAMLGVSTPAAAQYFGRNKVQYRTFDFKVLKTPHFDIYFYPESETAVREASRMAERWYARLSRIFDHQLRGRQPLILYATHTDFEQTNAISGELGPSTGGVTEILKRRIVLPLGGPLGESDHVIGHELVHAFQFDITSQGGASASGVPGAAQLPLWFVEGMAEYLSLGPVDPNTAMWMRDAVKRDDLPSYRDLNNPKYFPYRWGQAWWAYVTGRYGDEAVGALLRASARTGDPSTAIQALLKIKPDDLVAQWHQALKAAYRPILNVTDEPSTYGRALLPGKHEPNELNVSPAISPDGKRIVFLSSRGLFSIDLYLADAATGQVIRRLTSTALDPHFSNLQFIESAGAWANDNRRFVFSAVSAGRPELVIVDVDSGDKQEIRLPQVGQIFSPTWAPDGHAIAFSAITGGLTDLYIYDLQAKQLKPITNDAFADLQPAWSPDGRTIVFSTDRFTTRLPTLEIGRYQLALFDVASGAIQPLDTFPTGKSINPQWAGDGRDLFFIADPNGISNIYRLDIGSKAIREVTNLQSGVSGITDLSPALSVAANAGEIAFSVLQNAGNAIYVTNNADSLAGGPPVTTLAALKPAMLPPVDRKTTTVAALQADPNFGLPPVQTPNIEPYRPSLSLDHVGQPYLAVGTDPFGTFVGGGIALFWSDMLGNHNLGAAVQVGSSFNTGLSDSLETTSGLLSYQDSTHRWNWGAAIQQFPYITGAFQTGATIVDGSAVGAQTTVIERQINRGATGILSYPFSAVQRVELSGGYQRATFDRVEDVEFFDLGTGEVLGRQTQETSLGSPLNLGTASAALVYDNSFFGATSPILGQRYRLQVTPTVGTIDYTSVLADYRRYFMPARFYTIAGRILHYGRYGAGGDDPRLIPVFIGYPDLVRGYDLGSFSPSECVPTATDPCPSFDRLVGSRMLVGNLELRFPLLRPFGNTQQPYGPIPIEVALFADGGMAWTAQDEPSFAGGRRDPVASAGVALRVNLFGYLIAEFDGVRPFNRPGRGWMFEFGLSPGF
jgi:hypothetical protein